MLAKVAFTWLVLAVVGLSASSGHSDLGQVPPLIPDKSDPGTISKCEECSEKKVLRDGFVKIGSNYYYFSSDNKRWHDALIACQSKGVGLAYPLNESENHNLKVYLVTHFRSIEYWWLDGSDFAQEGTWVWQHDNSPITYFNWNTTESKYRDCLKYNYDEYGNLVFDAEYCDETLKYICQAQAKCNSCP